MFRGLESFALSLGVEGVLKGAKGLWTGRTALKRFMGDMIDQIREASLR